MHLNAKFFERIVLAVAVRFAFHELDHAAIKPAARRANKNADRGRCFAFTVAGIYHKKPFCVLTVIFAAQFVSFFFSFGHGLLLGIIRKRRDQGQSGLAEALCFSNVSVRGVNGIERGVNKP
jgi:hypothetical protein